MKFQLRLTDIELKNFRLFERIEVSFDKKLTVLIGENGAGKTALLEGIAKSLNVFTENMKSTTTSNFSFDAIYKDTDILFDTKESQTAVTVEFLEIEKLLPEQDSEDFFLLALRNAGSEAEKQNILQSIDNAIERLNEKLSLTQDEEEIQNIEADINALTNLRTNNGNIETEYLEENTNNDVTRGKQRGSKPAEDLYDATQGIENEWIAISWDMVQTKKNADISKFSDLSKLNKLAKQVHTASRREENLSLPVIVYYSSDRISSYFDTNVLEAEDTEVFNTYDDALNGKALNFKWFLDWFIWKEDNIKTQANVLNAVKEAIIGMFNDDETIFKDIYSDRKRQKDYRLLFEKGNRIVEANQLSSGEKSLLILVSDLARRLALANPLSNDPLKEGYGIVLIDEIDLHLHPRWQRVVIPKLQKIFPKIQWVITTHSPFVISSERITPDNTFLLTKDAETNKTIIISIEDLGKQTEGLEPNRILKEIMNVPLRNEETEKDIKELTSLLNPYDFDKPRAKEVFNELLKKLGTYDAFIVRATHRISVLERQKEMTL